jgi:hypothetical protein
MKYLAELIRLHPNLIYGSNSKTKNQALFSRALQLIQREIRQRPL